MVSKNKWNVHACVSAKSLQSCSTLCDPVDCSLPGSSVHEIFQARILEWVAISFSKRWNAIPNSVETGGKHIGAGQKARQKGKKFNIEPRERAN